MIRRLLALALLLLLLLGGCGEAPPDDTGFAGLGADAEGFTQARPGTPLRFPEDHGAHPDYRIEWWYLTANLEDETGAPLGVQWTLFRQALTPPAEAPPDRRPAPTPWAADQVWMAHMAVSRGETHRVAERFARSRSAAAPDVPGAEAQESQAGVVARPFRAWLDDWQLVTRIETSDEDPQADTFERLALIAHQADEHGGFGYRLALTAEGPLVLHGDAGFSQKTADGQGSMYVSQPFWRIDGEVTLDGETRRVTGHGWLDREWSSQLLEPWQTGWDWMSLHLADGHKLMAAQLRGGGEAGGDYRAGTWITPEGEATALAPDELELAPLAHATVAGRELPVRWRLTLPGAGLDLIVAAPHTDRWMPTSVPYWEGEVTVTDHDSGAPRGRGYLELTGY